MSKTLYAALCALFACTLTSPARDIYDDLTFNVVTDTDTDLVIDFSWSDSSANQITTYGGASYVEIYDTDTSDPITAFLSGGDFPALAAAGIGSVTFTAAFTSFHDLTFDGFTTEPAFGTAVATTPYSIQYNLHAVPDGGSTLFLLSLGVGGLLWMRRQKVAVGA